MVSMQGAGWIPYQWIDLVGDSRDLVGDSRELDKA